MSQGSLNPKIRFLGQKVWPVARAQTHRQSDYWGHPFRDSGFFPSTYHQGSAQKLCVSSTVDLGLSILKGTQLLPSSICIEDHKSFVPYHNTRRCSSSLTLDNGQLFDHMLNGGNLLKSDGCVMFSVFCRHIYMRVYAQSAYYTISSKNLIS